MKTSEDIKEGLDFINLHGFSHPTVQFACTQLGICQDELFAKCLNDFLLTTNTKELAEVYLRHHEARRRAKLILISKFILEKTQSPSGKTLQINRSLSTSSTKHPKSLVSPTGGLKLDIMKKNLLKKLKVAKNLKNIKSEEEQKRKNFEEKLFAKSCRSERKTTDEQKIRFARHDLRVKEILSKKYQDIEEHERRAISSMSTKRDVLKTHSSSFQTHRKKNSKVMSSQFPEMNIEQKLEEFNQKMNKSSERAKKILIAKANSSNVISNNVKKARAVKEEIDLKREQETIERIYRIGKNMMESTKRREELLESEQKRISLSLKSQNSRWNEEKVKIERAQQEKEKKIEEDSVKKEKIAQMIKESIDKELHQVMAQNTLRKRKDHEININRLQRQYERIRTRMIAKVKESEPKLKTEINLTRIRSRLESKLMSQLNI